MSPPLDLPNVNCFGSIFAQTRIESEVPNINPNNQTCIEVLEDWLRENPEHRPVITPSRCSPTAEPRTGAPLASAETHGGEDDDVIMIPREVPTQDYQEWTDAQPRSPWFDPSQIGTVPVSGQAGEIPSVTSQPVTPTEQELTEAETEVPSVNDPEAPRFKSNEHHISENAVRQRAKRIFTKRCDGSMKVSETIWNEWRGKGQPRKNLEQIFKSCGYDPDTYLDW